MPSRLENLQKLAARTPNDPFVHYCVAMEQRGTGQHDDALATFASLRERFADYVPQYLMAAQLCQELGRTDDARRWATDGVSAAKRARDGHAQGELESLLAGLAGGAQGGAQ